MRLASFCSGIEAVSVACAPLGWTVRTVSEIEPYCCELLSQRCPESVNIGDMTGTEAEDALERHGPYDLFVAGTPCQSFSVAGNRAGLDDPRGVLAFRFAQLALRNRPRWVVFENVAGLLSSTNGRDFAEIVGAFTGREVSVPPEGWQNAGCCPQADADHYGIFWRVLDAQFVRVDGFAGAVPQRRRRVFIVGYLGDWRRAAAVLLERACLCGDSAPRRTAGQGVAPSTAPSVRSGGPGLNRAGDSRGQDLLIPSVSPAMKARDAKGASSDGDGDGLPMIPVGFVSTFSNQSAAEGVSPTLNLRTMAVAHPLSADGADASDDGTGRGTPLVPIGFYPTNRQPDFGNYEGVSPAIKPGSSKGGNPPGVVLALGAEPGMKQQAYIKQGWRVRRITPLEAERLMGFPDGYTAIQYRGKSACDAPRYRALGNSQAVNCMRWLFRRIEAVEKIERPTP